MAIAREITEEQTELLFAHLPVGLGFSVADEESSRSSKYVNLSAGPRKNIAQLHPQENGIALVLRARDQDRPATMFAEIPVALLAGYKGTNASWLDGTGSLFERKGPAIAFLIPDEVDGLAASEPAWQQVAELLNYAKASA
ncbi:MAG: hypothetical protein ACLQUT_09795 [Thermoleophilia bacterium]